MFAAAVGCPVLCFRVCGSAGEQGMLCIVFAAAAAAVLYKLWFSQGARLMFR
jgi:hypothetical protein